MAVFKQAMWSYFIELTTNEEREERNLRADDFREAPGMEFLPRLSVENRMVTKCTSGMINDKIINRRNVAQQFEVPTNTHRADLIPCHDLTKPSTLPPSTD
ncbi:hypothetical protein KIN20_033302 [Parelaphostrongylus tenuis]|uniref:Uncharacterized protein n=1 Tax=Parelaphostrongylus tenuis TaxID=148309 RepID=A0AAD5WIR8_PARTN|nr:hypothetical protein KIN20_033302 [Parelaphostrongylus tenuis]